jgi:hypothetical protein
MQGEKKTIHVQVDASLLKNGYHLSAQPYNN